ncbi:AraC family transcriptional regulator [Paraflavitalea sp. CAU 1676]|uniref:AraC family transcriptional regulator n=1 Tax=Paraflavitalea sp. CAU 1676 TaxID=3032598 RepID=UPI0023DA2EE6|nr:AraC family transcriptional regulator [Paraflavitalea sp. CAU 1676]MDF2191475.1 AraC family transcriptional regulator [Paraflavitalea sp. CAU 1676]
MKPELRKITATPHFSFLVRKDTGGQMLNNWHYHPEIEILFIKKSSGTWMIGDHVGAFRSGDVVMVGANLPHCFRHEQDYTVQQKGKGGESICVKFEPDALGTPFLSLPEAEGIRELLSRSHHGLRLKGKTRQQIGRTIGKMLDAPPGKRLVFLLAMLEEIAASRDYSSLSSKGFTRHAGDGGKDRIKKIFDYTFEHFSKRIAVDEVASLVHMTPQSFCRYFKSKTNKTYVRFLMEVRIGFACRLLVEDELRVSEIGYACGYNSLSHFIHQFKSITGKRPLEYKGDCLQLSASVQ